MFSGNNKTIKYTALRVKTRKVNTPKGELSESELNDSALAYGRYTGYDEQNGIMSAWHFPPNKTESDFTNVYFALTNLKNYEHLRDKYKKIIHEDAIVKWNLIPFLLTYRELKNNPKYRHVAGWIDPTIFSNTKLFAAMIADGAECKHYFDYAYNYISSDDLQILLKHYPKIATERIGAEGTFIATTLSDHYDHEAMLKVSMVLDAGADINERVDTRHQYTNLQYLIAYSYIEGALALLDTSENINYELQDNHGRTALFLAVALGQITLVEKLILISQEHNKAIGLNTPDEKGRTPIMMAAALGYADSTLELINAGANLAARDNAGHDVHWYADAPVAEIKNILKSLRIDPDTSYYAREQRYLCTSKKSREQIVIVDDSGNEHKLLLSRATPHIERLKAALQLSEHLSKDPIFNKTNLQAQMLALIRQQDHDDDNHLKTRVEFHRDGQIASRNLLTSRLHLKESTTHTQTSKHDAHHHAQRQTSPKPR